MKTKLFILLLVCNFSLLSAGKIVKPEKVWMYGPINLVQPLLIDSVDLKGEKFKKENMLTTAVNFPEQNRFTVTLTPENNDFFRLQKPVSGAAFYLISFYVNSDSYGRAKIKVTSPDRFELYVNDKKTADKKSVEDSLKTAKSAETNLVGHVNSSRVVIKYLATAESRIPPAFKIDIHPDSTNKAVYSFNETPSRSITIQDVLIGKRVDNAEVSPSGRFVLMRFATTNDAGKTQNSIEVFDTKQSRTVLSEPNNRNQLNWMPKSDLLRYFEDSEEGWTLRTLNPATGETKVLARKLPKESYRFSPDEKTLYYSKKEELTAKSPKGLKRVLTPDDRQSNYRNRYYIYQYQLETGLSQPLTFGQNTASIRDLSHDGKKMLFSTTDEDLNERPFRKNSLYLLDLKTMQTDTVWKDERFTGSVSFSPDGGQLLVTGGAEAFNGVGLNINPGQIANSYDTQAFIFNISDKRINPITKFFYPSINSATWSNKDGLIYFNVQDKDRELVPDNEHVILDSVQPA